MAVASKEYLVHDAIDFPLAPEDIAGLMPMMEGCDVLVLERKTYAGYTLWRWVTSKLNRLLNRLFFGSASLRDMNFTQIYRTGIIPEILPVAKSPAFTTPEMIMRAGRLGLRVKSVEMDYRPRTFGSATTGGRPSTFAS